MMSMKINSIITILIIFFKYGNTLEGDLLKKCLSQTKSVFSFDTDVQQRVIKKMFLECYTNKYKNKYYVIQYYNYVYSRLTIEGLELPNVYCRSAMIGSYYKLKAMKDKLISKNENTLLEDISSDSSEERNDDLPNKEPASKGTNNTSQPFKLLRQISNRFISGNVTQAGYEKAVKKYMAICHGSLSTSNLIKMDFNHILRFTFLVWHPTMYHGTKKIMPRFERHYVRYLAENIRTKPNLHTPADFCTVFNYSSGKLMVGNEVMNEYITIKEDEVANKPRHDLTIIY